MTARLKFRKQWEEEEAVGFVCLDKDGCPQSSLTQQEPTESCDINYIVKRCGIKDHELPVAPPIDPKYYGDMRDMPDLRTCLDRVKDATDKFMALPAALRAQFHNRPDLLHEFVSDPRNAEKAVEMGLLKKREPEVKPPAPSGSTSFAESSA